MSDGQTYLHIGHGKTGSSAIQSFLALNAGLLREFGIDYPWHSSFAQASQGRTSTGNPQSFLEAPETADGVRLFSSEELFADFREGTEFFARLQAQRGPLTLLCYTRDLFDHFSSAYGQYVKRSRGTRTPEDFVNHYITYARLASVIRIADRMGAEIRLLNYSRVADAVEDSFVRLILRDRADAFLARSQRIARPVNRSLTRAELEFQRLFNTHARMPTSPFVSDTLVEELPGIPAEKIAFTPSMSARLIAKTMADITAINARMPEGHEIRIDPPDPAGTDAWDPDFRFSAEQLESLARSISGRLDALEISPEEVNTLRDVALKFETKAPLTREDALTLMRLALRARPNGPYLRHKVKQWSEDSGE